ncbi:hypothetical protein, partial [Streptomyces flavofungini]|uniref:hypothetical protein n=1 Tax=Streptomyces flavofungini TaxID=68200 RepID=UPI0034DE7429
MGSEGPRPGPGPHDGYVCKACGDPVGTAIRRRKVLGVFVPEWGPGPCRNAQCEACATGRDDGRSGTGRTAGRRRRPRHRKRRLGSLGGPSADAAPGLPPDPPAT